MLQELYQDDLSGNSNDPTGLVPVVGVLTHLCLSVTSAAGTPRETQGHTGKEARGKTEAHGAEAGTKQL